LPGAESYVSASVMNEDVTTPLRTEFESIENPIPNLEIWCDDAYMKSDAWREHYSNGTLDDFSVKGSQIFPCDVLRYRQNKAGDYFYTAMLWHEDKKTRKVSTIGMVEDIPRKAFKYYDRPYTSDTLAENAFRHDIRIPDSIFPGAWKNKLTPSENSYWLNDEYWKSQIPKGGAKTSVNIKRRSGGAGTSSTNSGGDMKKN